MASKGGQPNNTNAEKWTEQSAIELGDKLIEWISKPGNNAIKKFLYENYLDRSAANFLGKKFNSFHEKYLTALEIKSKKGNKGSRSTDPFIIDSLIEHEKYKGDGYVYIVRCEETTFYKIGISKLKFSNRLSLFQSCTPFNMIPVYLKYSKNYKLLEVNMLIKYREYIHKGEWLNLTESVLSELVSDLEKEAITQTSIKF